jgi:hypothetical protein
MMAQRAPHGPCRAIEGREDSIARRVDETAPVALDLDTRVLIVESEKGAPSRVPELNKPLSGPDDVGKEHGRKNPIEVRDRWGHSEPLTDVPDRGGIVLDPGTGKHPDLRPWHQRGHIIGFFLPRGE